MTHLAPEHAFKAHRGGSLALRLVPAQLFADQLLPVAVDPVLVEFSCTDPGGPDFVGRGACSSDGQLSERSRREELDCSSRLYWRERAAEVSLTVPRS